MKFRTQCIHLCCYYMFILVIPLVKLSLAGDKGVKSESRLSHKLVSVLLKAP